MKTRRDFLKGLGSSTLLLPMLPSLLTSRAEAAGKPPLRVMIFFGFNGANDQAFWPSLTPTAQPSPGVYSMKLADIVAQKGQVSPIFGPDFNPLLNNFSLIRGMCSSVSPYGSDFVIHDGVSNLSLSHIRNDSDSNGFDAPASGSSLDCIIENSPGFYTSKPSRSAIRVAAGEVKWLPSFYRPSGGRTPDYSQVQSQEYLLDGNFKDPNNALKVYNALFGNLTTTVTAGGPAYRGKVFEQLLTRLDALSKSSKLSVGDSQRLTSHAQFMAQVRDTVMSASGGGAGQCTPPAKPNATTPLANWNAKLQSIAAAFACDITRLGVMTLGNYDDAGAITWNADHHNSHGENSDLKAMGLSTDNVANAAAWSGWQAKRIAGFMSTLASLKEVDGSSVLDNTLIIWTNQHAGCHALSNYPIMIGGGAAGQFRMGEYIDYRTRGMIPGLLDDRTPGRPLSNLWQAVMRSVGVSSAEWIKQGEGGAYGSLPDGIFKTPSWLTYYDCPQGKQCSLAYSLDFQKMRPDLIPYFYKGAA